MNLRKCRRGKEGEKVSRCSLKVSREQESMRPVSGKDPGLILTEPTEDESLSRENGCVMPWKGWTLCPGHQGQESPTCTG